MGKTITTSTKTMPIITTWFSFLTKKEGNAIPTLNDDVPFSTAPACEECNYGFLPWGPLTCVDVPMYGGICSVKVCFRKRICNGRQQIKILSTMVPPQTPCEIENDDGNWIRNSNMWNNVGTKDNPQWVPKPRSEISVPLFLLI